MSGTATLVGKNDSLVINNRIIMNFADDDVAKLTFPNELVTVSTGKDGGSIFAFSEQGRNADFQLRILLSSPDDIYLNGLLESFQANFTKSILLIGEFSKIVGDGQGGFKTVQYTLEGGMFTSKVDGSENVSGDKEQAIALYKMKFALVSKRFV